MFPATIKVAPKSPRARANASIAAAIIPLEASGIVTRQNTRHSDSPAQQHKQVVSEHRRRKNERQRYCGIQKLSSKEPPARQEPPQGNADYHDKRGRD